MIDIKPLKEQSMKFPEPLKSIIEMTKDTMPEREFIDLFMGLRRKARELDSKQKEDTR
ncbi:MAG: hypothetical protein M1464_03805 [Candidatus Thermoplasmatota archaeon]|nr:hypothetical protein [Candidatus Thermoplasmatota archaeon]